jgi:hypothetical protein
MAGLGLEVGWGSEVAAEKTWSGLKYLSWPTFSMEARTRRSAEDDTTASWNLLLLTSFSSLSIASVRMELHADRGGDQLGINTHAGLQALLQFRDDSILFQAYIGFQFGIAHLVIVFRLQRDHHSSEVLANEFIEELRAGICSPKSVSILSYSHMSNWRRVDEHLSGMSRDARISLARSAHASNASSSERTSVLSQSRRRVVI